MQALQPEKNQEGHTIDDSEMLVLHDRILRTKLEELKKLLPHTSPHLLYELLLIEQRQAALAPSKASKIISTQDIDILTEEQKKLIEKASAPVEGSDASN